MDQMNTDKCCYLHILLTAAGAFFSVARSKKCTLKCLALAQNDGIN